MRTLLALLLMTTAAYAQDEITGQGREVTVGFAIGPTTARVVLENTTTEPLYVAVDGDTNTGIGPCNDKAEYGGISVGVDTVRHPPSYFPDTRLSLDAARRKFNPHAKLAVTVTMMGCGWGQSGRFPQGSRSADVSIPLIVSKQSGEYDNLTITVTNVPVRYVQ